MDDVINRSRLPVGWRNRGPEAFAESLGFLGFAVSLTIRGSWEGIGKFVSLRRNQVFRPVAFRSVLPTS